MFGYKMLHLLHTDMRQFFCEKMVKIIVQEGLAFSLVCFEHDHVILREKDTSTQIGPYKF